MKLLEYQSSVIVQAVLFNFFHEQRLGVTRMIASSIATRKPRNLTHELVDQLSASIAQGRLAPEQKLPSEAAIMEQFGVSRTVVREAISHLQAAGLVHTQHGIGTFVLVQHDAPAFKINPAQLATLRDVIDLLEFRIGMETEASALAAQRRTDTNIGLMRQAMDAFHLAVIEGRDAVSADLQFHQEIARATQNPHFSDMLNSLGSRAIPRSRLKDTIPDANARMAYLMRVNQEHENIFSAIVSQDAEASRAAMRTHLSNSRDRLKKGETSPQTYRQAA
jgi:GntR family transcriptional regulator, transcriptional repressor for pyruvate dehydrogenase complex